METLNVYTALHCTVHWTRYRNKVWEGRSVMSGQGTGQVCLCFVSTHIVPELLARSSSVSILISTLSNSRVGPALLFILFNLGFQSETKAVFVIMSSLAWLTVASVIDNTGGVVWAGSVYTWYLSQSHSLTLSHLQLGQKAAEGRREEEKEEERDEAFSLPPVPLRTHTRHTTHTRQHLF